MIRQEIHEYSPAVFKAMIDFMYMPEVTIASNDMVDLLDLCREYILPTLKQALEVTFSENIDANNFADLMQLSRAFELNHLRRTLITYGKQHLSDLKKNAKGWLNLTK